MMMNIHSICIEPCIHETHLKHTSLDNDNGNSKLRDIQSKHKLYIFINFMQKKLAESCEALTYNLHVLYATHKLKCFVKLSKSIAIFHAVLILSLLCFFIFLFQIYLQMVWTYS